MRSVRRTAKRVRSMLAVVGVLLAMGLLAASPADASVNTLSGLAVEDSPASSASALSPGSFTAPQAIPGATWNYWKCSATEEGAVGLGSGWGWRCYTWVRYDYCGGGREITTSQYTKMRTEFVWRDVTTRFAGWQIWDSRGDKGAVTHQAVHNGSAYHYVYTTVKPDHLPYVTCTLI